MSFPYKWKLADAIFTKDKGNVFSCFACGGGSTMGYKLAGFDVLGCNEIDPKMIESYKANHNPSTRTNTTQTNNTKKALQTKGTAKHATRQRNTQKHDKRTANHERLQSAPQTKT